VVALAIREEKVANKMLNAFLYSTMALVVLFALVLLSVYGVLPAGLTKYISGLPAGSPIDTAILLGATVILSLNILTNKNVNKYLRYGLYALIIASFVFLAAVNFVAIPILLALFATFHFVYILAWSLRGEKRISAVSLFILAGSVILVLGGSSLSSNVSSALRLNNQTVTPSTTATLQMIGQAWKINPAVGIGPNRFGVFWDVHKPAEINNSDFWATSFQFGSGLIPTMAVENGLLGTIAILAFLVLFVMTGFVTIFKENPSSNSRFINNSTFSLALYFWIICFVSSPGMGVLPLAFIMTGLFVGMAVASGSIGTKEFNLFANPKANFASVFSVVALVVAVSAATYLVWGKIVASAVFQQGVNEINTTGNIDKSQALMAKAAGMSGNDSYWRIIASLSVTKMQQTLQSLSAVKPENLTESARAELQTSISNSVTSAQTAINFDKTNYINWFTLGRVYEILAGAGMEGASDNAKSSYAEAQKLNPNMPALYLASARVAMLTNNLEEAKVNIDKTLALKVNYADAYFTRAQIEAAGNNIGAAIKSVESAALIDSGNVGLQFQLGILKYGQADYVGAVRAFEAATTITPDYANAKYFLGLSYYNVGRKENALKQFNEILVTNPDNAEVKLIISNLEAGKQPFAGAKPPVTNTPEKRTEPPIQ